MLYCVVRAVDRLLEEVEHAIEDGKEESIENVKEGGLQASRS